MHDHHVPLKTPNPLTKQTEGTAYEGSGSIICMWN
jgi:hypothetical protein